MLQQHRGRLCGTDSALDVPGEPAVSVDPRKGSLDNPPSWMDHEASHVGAVKQCNRGFCLADKAFAEDAWITVIHDVAEREVEERLPAACLRLTKTPCRDLGADIARMNVM